MSRRKGRDGSGKVREDDEVETLLGAAEDELLLNLSIDSHVAARGSSHSYLDPDLHRRFQALKSRPPPRQHPKEPSGPAVAEDKGDLFARFAALKENNNKKKGLLSSDSVVISPRNSSSLGIIGKSSDNDDDDDDDDDEVAKVMRWAVDAARLDPDDDDDDDDVDEGDDDVCSSDDDDQKL